MKFAKNFARYFVGILFIISGLIKINDPVGTAIKMEEYFDVFASDIASFFHIFTPYALAIAVIMSVLEVVLGIALIIKYRMNITIWALGLMIVFFTFLTFYSAYFNKVTDCGCFGDAIKLTPWQSFYKDIILVVLIGILFINRYKFIPFVKEKMGDIILLVTTLVTMGAAIYAIKHLPFKDFRAYKIGANIPRSMLPSEDLKYKFIMSKDGEEIEFDKYPTDTTLKFIEMVLTNPEANPKITDYGVWNDEGDFTEETFKGFKLIIIAYDVTKTNVDSFIEINKLLSGLKGSVVEPIVLTASDGATFEEFRHHVQLGIPYYFTDATVLKTIIRSNPGIALWKNGEVMGKWHYNDVPAAAEILSQTK